MLNSSLQNHVPCHLLLPSSSPSSSSPSPPTTHSSSLFVPRDRSAMFQLRQLVCSLGELCLSPLLIILSYHFLSPHFLLPFAPVPAHFESRHAPPLSKLLALCQHCRTPPKQSTQPFTPALLMFLILKASFWHFLLTLPVLFLAENGQLTGFLKNDVIFFWWHTPHGSSDSLSHFLSFLRFFWEFWHP